MFALTGKLFDWSKKDVNGKILVTLVLHKKQKEKEYKYAFSTFGDRIRELLEQGIINSGDSLEVKFFIKSREYNERWFTDLYADEIILLKKGKATSINMFSGRSKSF